MFAMKLMEFNSRRQESLLILVVAFAFFAEQSATVAQKLFSDPRQLSRGIKLETKPVSHDRLIALADRAFVGIAESIEIANKPLGDGPPVAIRTITFRVKEILFDEKGDLQVDEPYRVLSLALGSRSVKQGEKVLWFLAPNSALGLSQPVGIDSGDFRFLKSGDIVNLKQNENLLDPKQVQEQAEKLLESLPEETNLPAFRIKLNTWANRAAERPSGGPGVSVPYELLFARTRELHDQLKPNARPIKGPGSENP